MPISYNSIRLSCCALLILLLASCQKTETGFISNRMYYVENPLTTTQGSVTVSSALVADGSTAPLHVDLTSITDESGKDVMEIMTKQDSISGFTGSISFADSTLDLLNSKIAVTAAKPLSVNPIGGRIQLTPATQYVPVGTYQIGITVSNSRGKIDMPKACTIVINGSGSADTVYAGTYAGTFNPTTGSIIGNLAAPTVAVTYVPGTTNKLVYKFVDKEGKVYDAKMGGITARKGRWSMKQFDPYYPEVLTDTSVEYQFPDVPNQFPVFVNPGINGIIPRGNYGIFPAIPQAANDSGNPVFVFLDMAFFAKGTYIITTTFSDVSWK